MPEELTNYIKASLAQGSSKDQIRRSLIQAGWQENDIELALQLPETPLGPHSLTPSNPITNSVPENVINKRRSILNPKFFIPLVAIILLATVLGISYFFVTKKPDKANINNTSQSSDISQTNLSQADLKTCESVEPPKLQIPETKLEAKFVFRVLNGTKMEIQFLNLNTNEKIVLETEDIDKRLEEQNIYFSPDGKYLVYIVDYLPQDYPHVKRNRKFIFYDTLTSTRKEIIPTFTDGEFDKHKILWSQDSKQFLVYQETENSNGNYFNVEDLVAHDIKNLLLNLRTQKFLPHQYISKDELIFNNVKILENSLWSNNYSKVNLLNGSVTDLKTFSIGTQPKTTFNGLFTSDLKYYLFVEKEKNILPKQSEAIFEGRINDPSIQNELEKELYKELEANIGYINLENNCIKKVKIPQYTIYEGTYISLDQISADNNKVLISLSDSGYIINYPDNKYKTPLAVKLRMDIPSLTTLTSIQNPAINGLQRIDGEKIISIEKLSSLFNYFLIKTESYKTYLMNSKTNKNQLIADDKSKVNLGSSLIETPI